MAALRIGKSFRGAHTHRVLALIAACSMYPGDYFAINTTPQIFSHLGLSTVNLDTFSREVGEKLAGTPYAKHFLASESRKGGTRDR